MEEKRKLEKEISELKRKNSKLERIVESVALEYYERMKSNDVK